MKIWLNDLLGLTFLKGTHILQKHIFLIPLSPPHLWLHPPQRSPDWSAVRLLPGERLFHLSLPPRGLWRCSGWSAVAGGAVSSDHRDWRTEKLQSLLWLSPTPSRDGTPVYDGPRSPSARLESREPKCLALSGTALFSREMGRQEHCEGLKTVKISYRMGNYLYSFNPIFIQKQMAVMFKIS